MKRGPSTYSPTEVKRNEFVAICSEDPTENEGLPFWLGKVEKVESCVVNDDSSGSDDEDIPLDELPKKAKASVQVKVKEFVQVNKAKRGNNVKNSDRTYHEAKPAADSRAKSVYNWVPLDSIMYKFPKLTQSKSIPKEDANWIVCTAEIWLKSSTCVQPVGVEKMNSEMGFKMVPQKQ